MIKLKQLTTKDEQALEDQLRLFNAGGITDLNLDIRTFKYEAIGQEISIDENKKFDTKYDLVCYLYQALKCLDTIPSAIWNFLAVVYFKQLYKKESKEVKRLFIGDDTSHYPFSNLLKPGYDLYKFYRDTHGDGRLVKFLMLTPPNENGGVFLEVVKRQEIMKNKIFIEVCKKLFTDEGQLKKGISDSPKRLIALFQQYGRAYDLYRMPSDEILGKLITPKKHPELAKYFG